MGKSDKKRRVGRPEGEEKEQINMRLRKKKVPLLKKLAIDRREPVGDTVEHALKEVFGI